MGNLLDTNSTNEIKVKVWHNSPKTIVHGWPEGGCLFFTVNKGITICEFIDQINKHRRPEHRIKHLYKHNGDIYDPNDVLRENDLYI